MSDLGRQLGDLAGGPGLGPAVALAGVALVAVGGLLMLGGGWPSARGPRWPWLGRLPGDLHVGGERWSVHVPLATSLLFSVVLSLALWLVGRR